MKPTPQNIQKPTDAHLVETYKAGGDLRVLGELFSRYMPMIYGVCLKYLGDGPLAEDATMQIFEELVEKVRRHEVREFRTWVWSLARNHCLGMLRRRDGKRQFSLDETFVESADFLHLLDKRDDEERLTRLEDCLELLPAPQKRSVKLFFYEQRSYAEIADATDYNIKSVKSYIQNGKRNLKNCMERHGLS